MPQPLRHVQIAGNALPAASLFLSALLTLGCSSALNPTAPEANSFVRGGSMTGLLHGGNQPVSASTVTLYAAGNTGYGSQATAYAVATTSTAGTFGFTQLAPGTTPPTGPPTTLTSSYTCPTGSATNADPQMYLIASGGETQGPGNGANSAAAFVIALGKCSTVASLTVDMNEVTSVATMAALQQFFNPVTQSFGYPGPAAGTTVDPRATAFANGLSVISNMADIGYGQALSTRTLSATPAGSTKSVTVTAQSEASKVNLLANILAACVNNTSNLATPCNTLFTSAVPPAASVTSQPTLDYSSITATNETTVQALYFLLTNPTSGNSTTNMNALFSLPSGFSPFQPAYTTAPTDWTVGIFYTSTSTCTLAANAGTTSTAKFMNGVNNPAVDAEGNVWGANIATAGDLFEISPSGTPLTCGLGAAGTTANGLTIDPAGYVWVAAGSAVSSSYNLIKWNPSSATIDSTWSTTTTPTIGIPQGIAADGNGNIFFTASTNPTGFDTTSGSLNEFAGAGVIGASPLSITTNKIATIFSYPPFLAVDHSDNIWVAIPHIGTPSAEGFFQVYPSNNTGGTTYAAGTSDGLHTGFETSNVATLSGVTPKIYSPYGIAMGANGVVFSANGAGSGSAGNSYRWTSVTPTTGTPGAATATVSAVNLGGIYSTRGLAVDGAGNQWEANTNPATGNWVTGATTSGLYSLSEISAAGNPLSATSASGTGAYGVDTGSFQKAALTTPVRGVAIDRTGNVWVGMNSSTGTGIFELVGAGVPAVTPLSVAAATNTFGVTP